MNKKLLLIAFILIPILNFAQQDAWVYLTDKENVQSSIQNPITILTQEAIDRKNAHNISIDERDVPVNESYITQLKNATGITVMAKSKWFNAVHVRGSEADVNALANFGFVNVIEFADPNLNSSSRNEATKNKHQIEEALTDFNYGSTQNQIDMINLDDLHFNDYTGDGIVIAVLDAGFPNVNTLAAFQRIRDNNDLLNGYDFVDRNANVYAYTGNTHGTKVLSDMAGYIQDQFVGTAPDASYYLFRTEDGGSENPVEESYWVEAAERADSLGVHVINSSLSYSVYDNPNYSHVPSDMDGHTTYITRGANIASEKGILVVNSAGNSGNSSWSTVAAPADGDGVFTIGGVDSSGNYSTFSSRGSDVQSTLKPDVVARASSTFVINENNSIVNNSGTSFSSPIIAGAVACLIQALPNASVEEIKTYVRQTASQSSMPDYYLGYGIPNFQLAFDQALSLDEYPDFLINVFPNPSENIINIHFSNNDNEITAILFDVSGKELLQKRSYQTDVSLDISKFTSGIYILKIKTSKGEKSIKIIKS